jgi:hypothetical protein
MWLTDSLANWFRRRRLESVVTTACRPTDTRPRAARCSYLVQTGRHASSRPSAASSPFRVRWRQRNCNKVAFGAKRDYVIKSSLSCQVRRDLGCHEIHEQPRAERWCSAESVEEMQGYALKLLLRQDNLQVFGLDILCVPKTVSALMARRNRLSWRDDRVDPVCFGRAGLTIHVEDPVGG